ncbi:GNAT family N-acetyltransferase [Chryseobacterium kwangjuense]|nr:GNAT family N-acetyltransferase [Chryseobacterium kwangjuense]
MMEINYSNVESQRFNMNILRGNCENINVRELQNTIIQNKADIVILRLASKNSDQIQNLEKLGYEFFQADTLVYYISDFDKYVPKDIVNTDLEFVIANNDDKPVLKDLVSKIFEDYTNHYFSNKYLKKDKILEGYAEWVINFIEDTTKKVFLVKKNGNAIGFATCSLIDGVSEGVLYGILSDYAGGGIYSDIIRFTQNFYKNLGVKKMKVSTQVQNFAVQKVWSREGFFMYEAYNTIHINPLLNYSVISEKRFSLKINKEMIEDYGKISSDYNHIHFDDDAAKNCGFNERIGHGLIAEGEISRILGVEFPGNGTVFINNTNIFLAPLYASKNYTFSITVPFEIVEKEIYLCVIKVLDENGNVIMISYNNVIKK